MAKITEKKTQIYDSQVAIVCDLCGTRSRPPDWCVASWGNETVTLEHRATESYPEGTFGKVLTIDFCPDCLKKKLLPWLETQGVKAEYKDVE